MCHFGEAYPLKKKVALNMKGSFLTNHSNTPVVMGDEGERIHLNNLVGESAAMDSQRGIFLLFFFLVSLPAFLTQEVGPATIIVDGTSTIATNDDKFICATIDWWPHDKCNYNQCPWGNSSAMNLDLSHPVLAKAIQDRFNIGGIIAFKPLRIRIGGSLQDRVLYDVGNLKFPCHPFMRMEDRLFGFSKGCLRMSRWDELYHLFNTTGRYIRAVLTFGLNALYGRHQIKKGVWGGAWDSSNAQDFIKYTISKGHRIDSWEFGNELSGSGVGASVDAELYGKDLINLKKVINKLYEKSTSKPALVAPGGFFDQKWYSQFLKVSGPGVVNVLTHHIYNLGAGVDPNLVKKILDPRHLSKISETALLWHRLMGKGVLHVGSSASSFLRTYAHCSKGREGMTLLLINLSNQTAYTIDVQNRKDMYLPAQERNIKESFVLHSLKRSVAWVGNRASEEALSREEYHLTPKDGDIQSQTMVLNGLPIKLTEDGGIPTLDPVRVDVKSPIYVAPLSIAFIVFPNFDAPACV
ncbi:hypothetical protein EZV62_024208 [Acer yangbiense]|uniref:Heparanase-like protein 1 n=1 Tax=Acer yangbiense TaxID=1000413 RepID=A0A5C7H3X0_9ROSI|nr:hypothetical protein EZV62_024208 [Acer yangbiense]